jgi:hypothetical protein
MDLSFGNDPFVQGVLASLVLNRNLEIRLGSNSKMLWTFHIHQSKSNFKTDKEMIYMFMTFDLIMADLIKIGHDFKVEL